MQFAAAYHMQPDYLLDGNGLKLFFVGLRYVMR